MCLRPCSKEDITALQESIAKISCERLLSSKTCVTMWKTCLLIAPIILTESLVHGYLLKISSIIPSVFVTHIPAFANSCCESWNEFYFPDRSCQVKQFTAVTFQWKIHACNEWQRSNKLFCHISLIQICNTTWDKAGDMPSIVMLLRSLQLKETEQLITMPVKLAML